MTDAEDRMARIDPTVAHSARYWDYWLGGKNNYAADRAAGETIKEFYPAIVDHARLSRAFLRRAVQFLTQEAGITQFLDIGTGLPTANNTHEVAQSIKPACRIVYVDNDPIVLTHAQALLTSTPEGECDYIDSDVREIDNILAQAARTLDFGRPVGVMMLGILGYVPDDLEAKQIVATILDTICPGSHLVINDGDTTDPDHVKAAEEHAKANPHTAYTLRSPERIRGFFDGLELVEPGVVSTPAWRPEEAGEVGRRLPVKAAIHCGVGRKP